MAAVKHDIEYTGDSWDKQDDAPLLEEKWQGAERKPGLLARVTSTHVFTVALVLLAFVLGRLSTSTMLASITPEENLLAPWGTVEQTWQLNETFTQAPTNESEHAWDSIVPIGRGFITHPGIAPYISNIAVFHQLHCLHSLLVAHYFFKAKVDYLSDPANKLEDFEFDTHNTHVDGHHLTHCFDYLRRTLMCAADTNLEVLNENRTTNGWDQVKYCRNYDAVLHFAEQWKNSTDEGIVT